MSRGSRWLLGAAALAGALAGAAWLASETHPEGARPSPPSRPHLERPGVAAPWAGGPVAPPDATVADGFVAGVVVDEAGAPVAGARVCATCQTAACAGEDTQRTCGEAADDGAFRLSPPPVARLSVTASAPGFVPASATPTGGPFLDLRSGGVDDLRLVLVRGGARVGGVVRDRLGGEVVGAEVAVGNGPPFAATRTNVHGRFEVSVPEGPVRVTVRAPGYAPGWAWAVAPAEVEVVLTPGAAVAGRVVEADGGRPVPGVRLTARAASQLGRFLDAAGARTGSDGTFVVEGLAPGRYELLVRDGSWYGSGPGAVRVGLLETAGPVEVRVRRGAAVSGRVLLEDGAPAVGAELHLEGRVGRLHASAVAGSDGRVAVAGLPPDDYGVRVDLPGHRLSTGEAEVRLGTRDQAGLEWRLDRGYRISGRTLDPEGRAAPGVTVRAVPRGRTPAATESDGSGRFELAGLEAGLWTVGIGQGTWGFAGPTEEVRLDEETPDAEVALSLRDAGGDLVVRVVDGEGEPVAGAAVALASDHGWSMLGETDAQGTVEGRHLAAGEAEVIAFPPWHGRARRFPPDPELPRAAAQVEAGRRTEVVLELPARGAWIAGRVVDGRGAPQADVQVNARPADTPDGAFSRLGEDGVLTDADGRFHIPRLPEGRYRVRAWRAQSVERTAEVAAPAEDVVLVLPEASGLAGVVHRPDGRPAGLFRLELTGEAATRDEVFTGADGRFRMDGLPPGTWTVAAIAAEGTVRTRVSLDAGERRDDLVLDLAPERSVVGRLVRAADGAPVPDARVFLQPAARTARFTDRPETVTDDQGRFRFEHLTGDRYLGLAPTRSHWFATAQLEAEVTDVGEVPVFEQPDPETLGWLGLRYAMPPEGDRLEALRVVVDEVSPGSPAEAAGLVPGDVILAVDGADVTGRRWVWAPGLLRARTGETRVLRLADGRDVALTAQARE